MSSPLPMPDHDSWPIFSIPTDDVTPGPTDISGLLHKPAGALGMVRIQDGHLATGDGARWRIWGMNLTARTCLPSKQKAPILARHLAKYGINCVRLHFMDLRWPNGLLMRSSQPVPIRKSGYLVPRSNAETTRTLDPEALERLDYFRRLPQGERRLLRHQPQRRAPLHRGGRRRRRPNGLAMRRPSPFSTRA